MMTMMTVLLIPRAMDYKNPLSMLTVFFVSVLVMVLDKLGERQKLKFLRDFSFPVSMLGGVIFAIILGNTILAG